MSAPSRLNVKQLRVFVALLKDSNMSRVAEEIGLTQQAVSAHLAALRDVFQDPLFLRNGRGVTPTDLALELGGEMEDILASLERLVHRAAFDPAGVTATLNVSAADYAHAVAVTPALAAIRQKAPHLKLVLTDLEVDALPARMGSGEIDVVVSIDDYVPAHYPRRVLLREEYVCVAAKGSPFARGRHTLARLAAQPQVVVSPRKGNLVGSADAWFHEQGLKRETILSAPHFLLIPDIVVATGALAFVPSRLLPDTRLAKVNLVDNARPPGFDLIAAWHPRSAQNPLVAWFVAALGDMAGKNVFPKTINSRSAKRS